MLYALVIANFHSKGIKRGRCRFPSVLDHYCESFPSIFLDTLLGHLHVVALGHIRAAAPE